MSKRRPLYFLQVMKVLIITLDSPNDHSDWDFKISFFLIIIFVGLLLSICRWLFWCSDQSQQGTWIYNVPSTLRVLIMSCARVMARWIEKWWQWWKIHGNSVKDDLCEKWYISAVLFLTISFCIYSRCPVQWKSICPCHMGLVILQPVTFKCFIWLISNKTKTLWVHKNTRIVIRYYKCVTQICPSCIKVEALPSGICDICYHIFYITVEKLWSTHLCRII